MRRDSGVCVRARRADEGQPGAQGPGLPDAYNLVERCTVYVSSGGIMRIIAAVLLSGTLLLHAASIEVATIKPAVPDAAGSSGEDGRNGVLKMWNVSLKRCIRYAYTIPEDQIVGGPGWIDERRYDILAKADQPAGEPELLTMLQPLLADRFKLELHRETRNVQGYELKVAKGGI